MRLSDDKNLAFVDDPRRVAAQRELDSILCHIGTDVRFPGSAEYFLTVLPPLLKKLEAALVNLNTVEAQVLLELGVKEL